MAKKQKRERTESQARRSFVRACSFIVIFLSAIIFVVSAILNWVDGSLGRISSILNLVASLALLAAVAFPAYEFVRSLRNRKAWTIVYWVCLVVYVFGVVFGMIRFF